ncbi:hypothetical protein C8R45DRAFT_941645 [Mycena sanguinolenta]|nr:hypothetical protein C8R45DRAFT_941645 [Mycena sanguinolenta]
MCFVCEERSPNVRNLRTVSPVFRTWDGVKWRPDIIAWSVRSPQVPTGYTVLRPSEHIHHRLGRRAAQVSGVESHTMGIVNAERGAECKFCTTKNTLCCRLNYKAKIEENNNIHIFGMACTRWLNMSQENEQTGNTQMLNTIMMIQKWLGDCGNRRSTRLQMWMYLQGCVGTAVEKPETVPCLSERNETSASQANQPEKPYIDVSACEVKVSSS